MLDECKYCVKLLFNLSNFQDCCNVSGKANLVWISSVSVESYLMQKV